MLFNDISHWIFSPRGLVHEAEITYRAIFSLVDSKIIKKKVYICVLQWRRMGFSLK